MDRKIKHASLFSGIGGFDLAAEWMGWENIFQVEIDPFCNKVLEKNFPNAKRYGDIKQFDGKPYRGAIDVLTGGFPCQPFSTAGKRKGTEDDRHLWPEMLRVIREIQPRFVVGENVLGLLNWSGGLVFEQVQADLETQGYEVTSVILPACSKNAPHRRDRIWFVSYSTSNRRIRKGQKVENENGQQESGKPRQLERRLKGLGSNGIATNNNNKRLQGGAINGSAAAIGKKSRELATGLFQSTWEEFPTQSPICGGDDGVPNRMDRIKSLGNAVVPQIVYSIFKALNL